MGFVETFFRVRRFEARIKFIQSLVVTNFFDNNFSDSYTNLIHKIWLHLHLFSLEILETSFLKGIYHFLVKFGIEELFGKLRKNVLVYSK